MPTARLFAMLAPLSLAVMMLPAGGCILGTSPSTVNIELRKEKQALEMRIADLERQTAAQEQVIAGLQNERPTIPTLPPDRLKKMFTTQGLEFGRLTGGLDSDNARPGDEGVKVYLAPIDEEGQSIKMVGQITIEVFDLADSAHPLVGTWAFDVDAARKSWRGSFLDYNYVLECPWKDRLPAHEELTVKASFHDELTQTTFKAQQVIHVKLPGSATQPASKPASDR